MAESSQHSMRTCIGCRRTAAKDTLYRIVRDMNREVRVDATGRAAGRGAYVCSLPCLHRATRSQLQRSLRCTVGDEVFLRISHDLEQAHLGALPR